MEIFTSFALLAFFSFFYYLARSKDDFVIEALGEVGILIMGIIMYGTGMQAYGWDSTGVLHMEEIPGVSSVGWLVIFIAMGLFFETYRTLANLKK